MNHPWQIILPLFLAALAFHASATPPKSLWHTFGTIQVTVVSADDLKPLADATIAVQSQIWTNGAPVSAWTNYTASNGSTLLRLPVGAYWVSISKRDSLPTGSPITAATGRTNSISVQLSPTPRISGIVRDPSGAPAAGALVSFHPGQYPGAPDYAEVKSRANGQYELLLHQKPGGMVDFWCGPMNMTNLIMARDLRRNLAAIREFAMAPDFTINLWNLNAFANLPARVDLTLRPGITLSGSVHDTQGAPITNAAVDLSMLSGNSIVEVEPKPLQVDAQGLFSCPTLPQGRDYFIEDITAKGYGSACTNLPAKNAQTNHYEFPTFVLKRADRRLAGRVLGDGKPLAGANISFSGPGQPRDSRTDTDAYGDFAFDEVCEGSIQIFAGYVDPQDSGIVMSLNGGDGIEAHAGDTNILIQLHDPNAGAWITRGTVYDQFGHRDAGVVFRVWEGANIFFSLSSSDADGKYKVRWKLPFDDSLHPPLPSPKALLLARDLENNLVSVQEINGATSNLDAHLKPACSLSGRVLASDGKPLTNTIVSLDLTLTLMLEERAELERSENSNNGVFSFKALPRQGEYSLNVRASGYGSFNQTIKFAKASESIDLSPIILNQANLPVAGIAVTADGKPAPGVRVVATGQEQMPATILMTDSRGHFVFNQAAKGPLTISGILNTDYNDVYACNPYVYAHGGDTNILLMLVAPATHGAMEAWQAGDKQSAIRLFLDVDWSDRPLFDPYRILSLSEQQFVALPEAQRKMLAKEIKKQVERFRKLTVAVFEAGRAAAAKGESIKARKIFKSIKQCGAALGNPGCLRPLQIVGEDLEKKADVALHTLETLPGD
ncbi:MAG TPA: carboxypeptidase-like regulatory domain-containing protein [Verrucomicrobiae bacterium]|jgi:uncharacterized GH25 family protein|nr:carboxypeptidase-like regulatory domain-containing protein [Verrucomicrobiae bacterium]